MNTTALAGASVLQTRPQHQSAEISAAIEQAGGRVLAFPVIDIVATNNPDRAAVQAADIVIFVSRNAVDHGLDLAGPRCQLGAIGDATASAIRAAGRAVTIVPANGFDSEALLQEPELQDVAGKRIQIVRGDGGRELLRETLQSRGAEVTATTVYERRQHSPSAARLALVSAACLAGELHYIIAMSVASLERLLELLPAGLLEPVSSARLVTPSSRVIMAAGDRLPQMRTLLASSPGAADMVAAMGADWQQQMEQMND